jgi:tRNA (guanine-N7-)-methyltransferase
MNMFLQPPASSLRENPSSGARIPTPAPGALIEPPADWLRPSSPPLTLDIGCHRGTFLVEMACVNPREHFLGIEKLGERAAKTHRKLHRLGLSNAAVVHGEARRVLGQLPGASIAAIHILFPDPWPKRRHANRRLVSVEFLLEAHRILKPDGLLRVVTDNRPYASEITARIRSAPHWKPLPEGGLPAFPETQFQKKFREARTPVFDVGACCLKSN